VTPRVFTISAIIGAGALALAGCADTSGPLPFVRNVRLADELKVKPKFRDAVNDVVVKTFGPSPREMVVPKGATEAGLENGGIRLAGEAIVDQKRGPVVWKTADGQEVHQEGGYALYRRHCQHCHGSSGDGNGPTADFLFPRPRDYRKGLFKFTSTASNQKPTRADLKKTLNQGLHGTSMPAFEALMSPAEIEQVTDYLIFLSMRGEFETRLLTDVSTAEESDDPKELLSEEVVDGHLNLIFEGWKSSNAPIDPPIDRVDVSPESAHHASVVRGRDLFWKNDCRDCHGYKAMGNGQSFIDEATFQQVVFRDPAERDRFDDAEILGAILAQQDAREKKTTPPDLPKEIKSVGGNHPWISQEDVINRLEARGEIRRDPAVGPGGFAVNLDPEAVAKLRKEREAWLGSLDEWGQPLRPANLNRGIYKGGRRPIDIFWRINKGINGAKMPAHTLLKPEETWDLVNFVLALPREPQLIAGPPPPPTEMPAPAPPKVAGR